MNLYGRFPTLTQVFKSLGPTWSLSDSIKLLQPTGDFIYHQV